MKTNAKGIDVSEHQGVINHTAVKGDGINFAILRDGFGFNTVDKQFINNVVGFRNAGVEIPAIYHFSYALSENDAREEAKFAVKLAEEAGLPKSTIIFYDLEYDNVDRYAKDRGITIDKSKCCALTEAFCNAIEKAGYQAGVYANTDYRDRMYTSSMFDRYIFWHADYRNNAKADSRARFFQSASDGKVAGVNGNCDMNTYLGETVERKPASAQYKVEEKKSPEVIADEVIAGKWGNGLDRKKKLEVAGWNYNEIQSIVNNKVSTPTKSVDEIAKEVINGKWGNGDDRKKKLEAAGYDYDKVQSKVNSILSGSSSKSVATANSRDNSLSGVYKVTASMLNVRFVPNKLTNDNIVKVIKSGERVQNYGYYSSFGNSKWLLIQSGNDTGWVDSRYVTKI